MKTLRRHISCRNLMGWGLMLIMLMACTAQQDDGRNLAEPIRMRTVHDRYLSFPVPSVGIEAQFNPPVLRWPVHQEASTSYDVRLSQDSLFGDRTIEVSAVTSAMYNPHRALSPGDWYWQYRITGAEWSAVQHFRLTDQAIKLVSPPASEFLARVPAKHPRVLTKRHKMSMVKQQSIDDESAILREANHAMNLVVPGEEDGIPTRVEGDKERNRKLTQDASQRLGSTVYNAVMPLSQAFVLTGDHQYRQHAIRIAKQVAFWDPHGVSSVSDFGDARCMLAMAIVFDTFYNELTSEEKSLLLKAIHVRADRFYKSWRNNVEARLVSGHVWQHILHYFFQTALAVKTDDPDADQWLQYAYELFLARTPILGGVDGAWAEGVSYFRMNMETVLDIPLFIKQYTGFDFINAHPWYEANVKWMIYSIPPGSSADGFGDNTEEVLSPGAEYIAYAREIAKLTNNPLAAWYAEECEKYERPDVSAKSTLRWIRLVKTNDLPMPALPDDIELSGGMPFLETGNVSMHSDPHNTSENLVVAMRSSPYGSYGHFLSDQNAFNVLYGGKRTFFRTGYKVTMKDPHRTGWYQHTKSNNSVLIDGEGQPYSTESFGWIARFLQGKEIVYAKGDASNAYMSKETQEDYGVKKFYRHLLLLKPDIVVVYDELEAERDVSFSWLIHSMKPILLDSSTNTFASTFDHVSGRGKLWSSSPVQWALTDEFEVPAVNWRKSRDRSGNLKQYDDEQWHLKATNRSGTSSIRFLALIQLSGKNTIPEFVSQSAKTDKVEVTVGKWRISANLSNNVSQGLLVTDTTQTAAFTTHDLSISLRGKSFRGRVPGSAKLLERVDGDITFIESTDQLPHPLKQSWLYCQRKNINATTP